MIKASSEPKRSPTLRAHGSAGEQSRQAHEKGGADRCDNDHADQSAPLIGRNDENEQPDPDDAAEDSDQDVTDDSVAAFHDETREPPSDGANDEPGDGFHRQSVTVLRVRAMTEPS